MVDSDLLSDIPKFTADGNFLTFSTFLCFNYFFSIFLFSSFLFFTFLFCTFVLLFFCLKLSCFRLPTEGTTADKQRDIATYRQSWPSGQCSENCKKKTKNDKKKRDIFVLYLNFLSCNKKSSSPCFWIRWGTYGRTTILMSYIAEPIRYLEET